MNNKVLLMILDGWGNGRHDKADVISTVHPEYISAMTEKYPHAELRTDGENVGLPDGQMGNSEVGHLNIGAGRVDGILSGADVERPKPAPDCFLEAMRREGCTPRETLIFEDSAIGIEAARRSGASYFVVKL